MLIRIVSDLHIEFWDDVKCASNKTIILEDILNEIIPPLNNDSKTILVIAGDIGVHQLKYTWVDPINILSERFESVLFVTGNHFFYNSNVFGSHLQSGQFNKNVHLLENNYIDIENHRFIGANLWTDFYNRNPISMLACQKRLNDYRLIRKPNDERIIPEDVANTYIKSKEYIFNHIHPTRNNIIITHTAPSSLSIPEKYFAEHEISGGYISNLEEEIMENNIDFWIHGHTHESFDYYISNTRIICNPYGYRDLMINQNFNKKLVVDI